eukprot:8502342-Pyramimonas_sp.AAC.1
MSAKRKPAAQCQQACQACDALLGALPLCADQPARSRGDPAGTGQSPPQTHAVKAAKIVEGASELQGSKVTAMPILTSQRAYNRCHTQIGPSEMPNVS